MARKRPETTIYLGEQALQKLQAYRARYPHPPSLSTVVREAVEQYLSEDSESCEMPTPAAWVEMSEAHLMRLQASGVDISTEALLNLLQDNESTRIDDVLRGAGR